MANNRWYFWSKLTWEFVMIDKLYNDYLYCSDEKLKAIQTIINRTQWMQQFDWRPLNKCPYVFFWEWDTDYLEYFKPYETLLKIVSIDDGVMIEINPEAAIKYANEVWIDKDTVNENINAHIKKDMTEFKV